MSIQAQQPVRGRAEIVPDPGYSLTPTGNLRRRLIVSRFVESGALIAALIAVGVLGLMVFFVAERGVSVLSWSFFTSRLPVSGGDGSVGGMGPAFVGTAEIIAIAIIVALPVGVLLAIYLHEFAGPRASSIVRAVVDVMNGMPTIVIGIFIFSLFVYGHSFSAWSGSLALAIVVVPIITRYSMEAISHVPGSLRGASEALGVARWRAILTITLPSAWGGILTGTIIATARAAGETAPLLFTSSSYPVTLQLNPLHGISSVPLQIYTLVESGYPDAIHLAWGAAFVLLVVILIANVGARMLLRHFEKKRGISA